jgi:hypothetical protein
MTLTGFNFYALTALAFAAAAPHFHQASHKQRGLTGSRTLIYAHDSREAAKKNWTEFGADPHDYRR